MFMYAGIRTGHTQNLFDEEDAPKCKPLGVFIGITCLAPGKNFTWNRDELGFILELARRDVQYNMALILRLSFNHHYCTVSSTVPSKTILFYSMYKYLYSSSFDSADISMLFAIVV
jgi:hypothetical protein